MEKYKHDINDTFFRLRRINDDHPAWTVFQDLDVFKVFIRACCYAIYTKGKGVGQFEVYPIDGMSREDKRQAMDKLVSRKVVEKTSKSGVYKMGEYSPWRRADDTGGSSVLVSRGTDLTYMVSHEPEILRLELWMRFGSFEGNHCVVPVGMLDFISRQKARRGIEMMTKQGIICPAKPGVYNPTRNPTNRGGVAHNDSHRYRRPPTTVKFLTTAVCDNFRDLKIEKQPIEQPKLASSATIQATSPLEGRGLEGSKLEGRTIKKCPSPDHATDKPISLTEDLPTPSVDLPVVEVRPSAGPTSEQFSLEYLASLTPVAHCVQPAEASSPADTSLQGQDQTPPAGEGLSPTQAQYGRSSEEDLAIQTSRLIQKLEVLPHLEPEEYWPLWNFIHMRMSMGEPTNSRDMNELFHMLYNPDYPEIWIDYFEQLVQDRNPKFNPGTLGGRYSRRVGEEIEQLLGSSQAYTYYIQLKQYLLPNGDLEMERRWKRRDDPEAWAEGVLEGCRLQMDQPFSPARVEACALRLLCEQQEWRKVGSQAAELYDQLVAEDPDLQKAAEAFALQFWGVRPDKARVEKY